MRTTIMAPPREWARVDERAKAVIASHHGEAPVRLGRIAAELGLTVKGSTLPAGISGELRPNQDTQAGFAIKVNRHDPEVRQRFTVAHEIAHYLIHRDQIGSGISDDALYRSSLSDAREAEANRLASELLMPQSLVVSALSQARELGVEDLPAYMAKVFNVSEAAMKIRLGL